MMTPDQLWPRAPWIERGPVFWQMQIVDPLIGRITIIFSNRGAGWEADGLGPTAWHRRNPDLEALADEVRDLVRGAANRLLEVLQ